MKAFGEMVGNFEVSTINGFDHAYGWMKVPEKAANLIKSFIKKY